MSANNKGCEIKVKSPHEGTVVLRNGRVRLTVMVDCGKALAVYAEAYSTKAPSHPRHRLACTSPMVYQGKIPGILDRFYIKILAQIDSHGPVTTIAGPFEGENGRKDGRADTVEIASPLPDSDVEIGNDGRFDIEVYARRDDSSLMDIYAQAYQGGSPPECPGEPLVHQGDNTYTGRILGYEGHFNIRASDKQNDQCVPPIKDDGEYNGVPMPEP